jgi:Cd(II)/Pb(II)-responsive transcriptional regulator
MGTAIRIGELAARAQSPVQTVRYYERMGLLPPPARSAGNYRLYGEPHLQRLLFIRHCRVLDLSLTEIRSLLDLRDSPAKSCDAVNAVVDAHIEHVARRIGELRWLQRRLKSLRAGCAEARVVRDCRILDELSRRAATPLPARSAAEARRKRERSNGV